MELNSRILYDQFWIDPILISRERFSVLHSTSLLINFLHIRKKTLNWQVRRKIRLDLFMVIFRKKYRANFRSTFQIRYFPECADLNRKKTRIKQKGKYTEKNLPSKCFCQVQKPFLICFERFRRKGCEEKTKRHKSHEGNFCWILLDLQWKIFADQAFFILFVWQT